MIKIKIENGEHSGLGGLGGVQLWEEGGCPVIEDATFHSQCCG